MPDARRNTPLGTQLDKTVVIVSTGRTGTLALSRYLGDGFHDVKAVHEPLFSQHFRFVSNLHHCGHLTPSSVAWLIKCSRQRRLRNIASGTYVESNPFLHGCLDGLDNAFHNVHVVHVVRHPVDYIRSALKHGVFSGIKGLGSRFCPYWMLKPERYEPEAGLKWAQMEPEERLAWRWARVNADLDLGAELLGQRYLRIRFEDLFDAQASGLRELTRWLGFDPAVADASYHTAEQLNQGKRATARPYDEWPDRVVDTVSTLCRDQIAMYGYRSLNPSKRA